MKITFKHDGPVYQKNDDGSISFGAHMDADSWQVTVHPYSMPALDDHAPDKFAVLYSNSTGDEESMNMTFGQLCDLYGADNAVVELLNHLAMVERINTMATALMINASSAADGLECYLSLRPRTGEVAQFASELISAMRAVEKGLEPLRQRELAIPPPDSAADEWVK